MKHPFILFSLLLSSALFAQDRPKTMIKVEVQLQGPAVPAGSFATKPGAMYRAGNRYCRIEEAPDPSVDLRGW